MHPYSTGPRTETAPIMNLQVTREAAAVAQWLHVVSCFRNLTQASKLFARVSFSRLERRHLSVKRAPGWAGPWCRERASMWLTLSIHHQMATDRPEILKLERDWSACIACKCRASFYVSIREGYIHTVRPALEYECGRSSNRESQNKIKRLAVFDGGGGSGNRIRSVGRYCTVLPYRLRIYFVS